MPDKIKYNATRSEANSLFKGGWAIRPNNDGGGPTSTTGFYTGIEVPAGGWSIYCSGANGLVIRAVETDADLISLTNQISGQNLTTVEQCLVYYATQTDKIILNKDCESIVTDGLVLNLDASNTLSYPRTGTTIYDLSGNGNNGILNNGVGFSQTNGGVLTLDGVNDYITVNSPNLASTNNTIIGAARYSGATRGRIISGRNNNWLMGHWSNSTENYYAEGWVSTVGKGTSDTNWRIYTALGNTVTDSYALYVNNLISSGPNPGGSQGPNGFGIGYYAQGNSEFSTGEFSFLLAYNRILTIGELAQNYNALKTRFGLQ